MLAIFQSVGNNNPVVNELFKNALKGVDNSCAHSFKMRGRIRSGPVGTCEHSVCFQVFFHFAGSPENDAQFIVYYVAKFGVNYFVSELKRVCKNSVPALNNRNPIGLKNLL